MRYQRIVSVLCLLLALLLCGCSVTTTSPAAEKQTVHQAEPIYDEGRAQTAGAPSFADEQLTQRIEQCIQHDRARYSIYANRLDVPSGQPLIFHDERVRSASMIKLFILAKAYEDIQKGTLSEKQQVVLTPDVKVGGAGSITGWPDGSTITVEELLRHMITESDNTATNIMIDLLEMDAINQYIQGQGYTQTVLARKMMDTKAAAAGQENYTSASDLGKFFTRLYRHQCVSPEYDDAMLDLLRQQEDRECFPTALPDAVIAHKTGELDHLYHDGGIVYSTHGDYVLCILTEAQTDRSRTLETMRQLARQLVNS